MSTLPNTNSNNPHLLPIFVRHGDAQVSYAPGHDPIQAEVEFVVRGWRTACTAAEARDLVAALSEALADPLVATMLAVRNSAGLADRRAA